MATSILVVEDEKTARMVVSNFLRNIGYEVQEAGSLAAAREIISQDGTDIIILDIGLPDGEGTQLLPEVARLLNRPQVIIMTAFDVVTRAVDAMKNGAQDYMVKPIDLQELGKRVQRADELVSMRRELNFLRSRASLDKFIVGNNAQMKQMVELAHRASETSVSTLITGPTGTGKEVMARFIHENGSRSNKPFIDVNCPAIPAMMFESELFGHESGAFTGATHKRNGLMETADGGILFLDEISSMPMDLQAKFLRALEERSFRRVGGNTVIKVDVQVVAASNRNLQEMIAKYEFREDLYYRLKVVNLDLPSLAERKSDIPDLVGYFLQRFNMAMGKNILDVNPLAMEALVNYSWPGNIRELRNAIERAVLLCDEDTIDIGHIPLDIATPKAKS
ncbi:MAG: sigma-54-dependent Fis family transcriptional regulator [Anaerolineaceae bacterium]|nr:sigma-54-dependent Fis family transcriptional regulator [Anaerolineaceae bacterium]